MDKKPGVKKAAFVILTAFITIISINLLKQSRNSGIVFASDNLQAVSSAALLSNQNSKRDLITVDFKDADIQNVLRVLALKGNVNIIANRDVSGTVTVKLTEVPWEEALDAILKTYDYGYERKGNIITVTTMEKIAAQKETQKKISDVQPLVTEVFTLKYVDAEDVKETLEPQLSPRGTITVLKMTTEGGWQFSGGGKGEAFKKLEKDVKPKKIRSKVLIVSDIPSYLENIKNVILKFDVAPQQILIEARIVEVNEDVLRDLGLEWGTGSTGAENTAIQPDPVSKNSAGEVTQDVGGRSLNAQITPSAFEPKSSGLTAANTGLKFLYQRLRGTQFEVILHAIEEDADTNTLSAPRILTLNNQEATILVGTKYPILTSEVSSQSGTTVTSTLDYYQDIGIQLNVIPQISGDKFINMVIHPAVTSFDSANTVGTNKYPVISTREAETRVLLENNQTIVIGGLLKDVKKKSVIGVPVLKDIPFLGNLFKRNTNDTEKIDLLIFITASIISPDEVYVDDADYVVGYYQFEQEMIREKLRQRDDYKARASNKPKKNKKNK